MNHIYNYNNKKHVYNTQYFQISSESEISKYISQIPIVSNDSSISYIKLSNVRISTQFDNSLIRQYINLSVNFMNNNYPDNFNHRLLWDSDNMIIIIPGKIIRIEQKYLKILMISKNHQCISLEAVRAPIADSFMVNGPILVTPPEKKLSYSGGRQESINYQFHNASNISSANNPDISDIRDIPVLAISVDSDSGGHLNTSEKNDLPPDLVNKIKPSVTAEKKCIICDRKAVCGSRSHKNTHCIHHKCSGMRTPDICSAWGCNVRPFYGYESQKNVNKMKRESITISMTEFIPIGIGISCYKHRTKYMKNFRNEKKRTKNKKTASNNIAFGRTKRKRYKEESSKLEKSEDDYIPLKKAKLNNSV